MKLVNTKYMNGLNKKVIINLPLQQAKLKQIKQNPNQHLKDNIYILLSYKKGTVVQKLNSTISSRLILMINTGYCSFNAYAAAPFLVLINSAYKIFQIPPIPTVTIFSRLDTLNMLLLFRGDYK
eukprot:TRINITY_DN751_c0_g1_i5.p4 TRINITY_DN751_c0_g1~~TRINITY_DN751_c0_g1_i5.p4  ORF type:complete len:124 (-),score=3.52 TRINITY_DN751_c0_g1_i5:235-606(-)